MKSLILLFLAIFYLEAKYLDSKSCSECHEQIYNEHTKSMHHNSTIFRDEVHKKVALATSKDSYECALCHMPNTPNLSMVMKDSSKIDENDVRNQDGVSCFYCHQIDKIHTSKLNNINFSRYKEGESITFYGNLPNADGSDKHESASNEIFKNSTVCMGCHSHKENNFGIEVCNSKDEYNATSDCIGCHMPKKDGLVEKYNKKSRSSYATHEFLGIRSDELVKKATKLSLKAEASSIKLSITNKMGHSIITQPMRLKFVKTTIKRGGEVIWSNFKESPLEDKEATFAIIFEDENAQISLPAAARGFKVNNNLKANQIKEITYSVELKKGDEITSTWISYIINPNIAKKMDITDENLTKPLVGDSVTIIYQ